MADSVLRSRSRARGVRSRIASLRPVIEEALTGVRVARGDLLTAVTPPIAGIALAEIVVLLVWISDGQVDGGASTALRVGADLWLMAHGTGFGTPQGELAMVPFGMALIPIALTALTGHRLASTHSPHRERRVWRSSMTGARRRLGRPAQVGRRQAEHLSARTRGGTRRHRPDGGRGTAGWPGARAGRDVAMVVVPYVVVAMLVAVMTDDPAARPSIPSAMLGTSVVSLIGAWAGVLVATRDEWWRDLTEMVPTAVRTTLAAAAAGTAVLIAAGSLVTAVVLATHIPEIAEGADRLTTAPVGGFGLFLVQLVVLPNVIVWAAAFTLGPGFATGVHGVVRPSDVHVADLPGLPMFAGLPTDGIPAPLWLAFALAPVTAGWVMARLVRRDVQERPARICLLRVGPASLLCGTVMAMIAAASGGSLGSGELASFGPSGLRVGLAATVEVGLVAMVATVLAARGRRTAGHRARGYDARPPEPPEPVTESSKRVWQVLGSWLGSLRQS